MKSRTASEILPYVQEMIAGTNGNMYRDLIGRLQSYPIPKLPIGRRGPGLFLDIGCGWGRWMASAARLGFKPVGVDIKWEAAKATRQVLADLGLPGFAVVADLRALPFKTERFDFVWSYSVIQHTHRKRACACLQEIARVLKKGCECQLEFPIRPGLWNRIQAPRSDGEADDYASWCVRYYTIAELRSLFLEKFGNFTFKNHCYFGIGIQPIDLRYVRWRFKPIVLGSLILHQLSRVFSPLKRLSDSIYVAARKTGWAVGQPPETRS